MNKRGGVMGSFLKSKKKTEASPQIKAIIFDLGNVLLNYDLKKAAREFSEGCKVPLFKLWFHFLTSSAEKDYACGKISSRAFYESAKKSLQFTATYPQFRRYWNGIFTENEGMDLLLQKLKKRYPLYLISNTNAMHYEYVKKKYKILRHFKRRFASHEVGHRKPDREIYEKALAAMKLRPEETVFIDDMAHFVAGAKKVGIHAIRFRNRKQLIDSLRQLGIRVR